MPPETNFKHLELPELLTGAAKLGGGGRENDRTKENKVNRRAHADLLRSKAGHLNAYWKEARAQRAAANAPKIPNEIPILLQVDPRIDIDALTNFYDFEVVSEQDDGYLLVTSSDIDFTKFLETVAKFKNSTTGGATAAQIYDLSDSEDQISRLQRILSDDLFAGWNEITDDALYVVDVGVECAGKARLPKYPTRRERETTAKFDARLKSFNEKAKEAYLSWEDIKLEREAAVDHFVTEYQGRILDIADAETIASYAVPDSFTVRVQISGKGLRDLVLNFPFVFEVSSPDEISVGSSIIMAEDGQLDLTIEPPEDNAPKVVVIDSGIQQNHPLMSAAIDTASSICYVPDVAPTDVNDHFRPNGHGTRVAGAILFPNNIPRTGTYKLPFRIGNARVLDENNNLSSRIFPPRLLKRIVDKFHVNATVPSRIFNHSIASKRPCSLKHMSAWATSIDDLSFENDVLFVQAAGNLPCESIDPIQKGILDHFSGGDVYPKYLLAKSSRVANPSQSMQALTVGSVSLQAFETADLSSLATQRDEPSAFTRTGLGIWDSVKPDVVEYGGDYVVDKATSRNVTTPAEVCPELVRSTLTLGASFSKNDVGTSYAAPKVAGLAAELQTILPEENTLLYRALVAQSARWPDLADAKITDPLEKLRCFGYGIPNRERATENSEHRITLFTKGDKTIKAREAQIFRIPIPDAIASQANEQDILVEICLSYSAKPRRTRRSIKSYFGVWVDWEASKLNETIPKFKRRVLKGEKAAKGDTGIGWEIGKATDKNNVKGARRNLSSLQKDWAIVKAHELPKEFCIAVVGHPGWDLREDAFAKYSLVVSFEAINKDLPIYDPIKVELGELEISDVEVGTT